MKNFIQNSLQSQKIFFRYFRRKGWKRFLKDNIIQTQGSNKTKALSVALGIFVGLSPFIGFHTVIVIFLATVFKLNKLISYLCTHISFPPLIPFIIMISMWIGGFFLNTNPDFQKQNFSLDLIKNHVLQFFIGSIILSIFSGIFFGSITFIILEKTTNNKLPA